ncbi:uncharacterized protein MEPE_04667 [Melanopsichium pennsylvanicum]|uniref:Secreted protein n=1 Tax=Melanopsichium pennsylvanicum TaxID=63383 RepID=A0AAJ4XRW7_9BASI|nr:uncharacterized protein MEPE_04667 [Melanopsichium pennsylvanicum]
MVGLPLPLTWHRLVSLLISCSSKFHCCENNGTHRQLEAFRLHRHCRPFTREVDVLMELPSLDPAKSNHTSSSLARPI